MTPKFDTYVAVFGNEGDALVTRFVTSVDGSNVHWESGKPAMPFAESYAKDIVYGLTLNGYAAAVITVLHGLELNNR